MHNKGSLGAFLLIQSRFRWVACHLDHMCELPTDRARRVALEKLPPTLPATYERILMRVEGFDEEVKRLVQRTLLLMASGHDSSLHDLRLNFREICEAVSLEDDSDTLHEGEVVDGQEILRWCGSLVRTSGDGKMIEFAHFTVQEYLQNDCLKHPTLSKYGVSEAKACHLLGPLCLRFLLLQNHQRPPEVNNAEIRLVLRRRSEVSFYEHAAMYWPYYVHHQHTESLVAEQLDDLFQVPKTSNFCSWSIEIIRHCLEGSNVPIFRKRDDFGWNTSIALKVIRSVLRPDFTPLHMAAALGFPALCRRLLDSGASADVNSRFGTPLHCSLGNLTMFSDKIDRLDCFEPYDNELSRRQTSQLFLESCSNPNVRPSTLFWDSSVLGLALSSHLNTHTLDMATDLIRAGILVHELDLDNFEEFYKTGFDGNALAMLAKDSPISKALANFLDIFEQPGTESPMRSQLYSMTLRFAERVNLKRRLAIELCFDGSMSDQDMRDYARRAIVQNDVRGLQRFLDNGRLGLVQSPGIDCKKPTRSSVHIAVLSRSLDVLTLLLKLGCDPNTADEHGDTPATLCYENLRQNMLLVLLQHGGSTTIANEDGQTIWHKSAARGSIDILEVLVENEERDAQLRVQSKQGMTPICTALHNGRTPSVLLLARYCNTTDHWKSTKSLFRAAARIGSSDVVQRLLDVGLDTDGMDSVEGNPLHYLNAGSSIECVQLLQDLFPLDQRRGNDQQTPLEAVLLRAVEDDVALHEDVFKALLPSATLADAIEMASLWSFLCTEIVPKSLIETESQTEPLLPSSKTRKFIWLRDVFFVLIRHGALKAFEEQNRRSGLHPFITQITQPTPVRQKTFLDSEEKIPRLAHWPLVAEIVAEIAKETEYWTATEIQPCLTHLLAESVIHDDEEITALLLKNGVNLHLRVHQISPVDLVCFPDIPVSQQHFERLLAHTNAQQLSQGIKSLGGRGPLHFTAASHFTDGSVFKLKRLLQNGANVNLPLADHFGSPLAYHIRQNSTTTAEMLIDFEADPWATGSYYYNAPNEAVMEHNLPILRKILTTIRVRGLPDLWGQPCSIDIGPRNRSVATGLHLAASFDLACLRLYLDEGLVSDLEVGDEDLETPMHYAARSNIPSILEFLKERGGDIDATCRSGLTPLHQAVKGQHLSSVQTLLRLGAKQKLDSSGWSPLMYAYAHGGLDIVKALESAKDHTNATTPVARPKGLSIVRNALDNAIRAGDLAACRNICAAGCPVDVELSRPERASSLMVALCEGRSIEMVKWLVEEGAPVSAVYQDRCKGKFSTAIDAALANPNYNALLPLMINKFLQEGGRFLGLPRNPLTFAIDTRNSEGLGIFLDVLKDRPSDFRQVNYQWLNGI